MNFFTKVDLPVTDFKIDYNSRLAFFGSCFADNISAQFTARKFNVLANPFGTVYNPVSLESQIKTIADGKVFGEDDVFQDTRCDELWHCWDAHSSLSASTRKESVDKLNAATAQARDFLRKTDVVFITLGTAFVYYLKDSGKPVSNCHRQDPGLFERRLISVDEAASAICEIVENLRKIAATAENSNGREPRIVFTVSPLRHMSDGAHNNTLSKATLQLAVDKVVKCGTEIAAATYFPSYEIVMDELRDYRFYASDMLHPSQQAVDYIWERLVEHYFSAAAKQYLDEWRPLKQALAHRPFNPDSEEYRALMDKTLLKVAELRKKYPTFAK